MNIDETAEEFWKIAQHASVEEIEENIRDNRGIGVGVDLGNKTVVIGTPQGFIDMDIDLARAMAIGITLAADALQQHIAKNN